MYNYNTLKEEFLQYKYFLGMKYRTERIVINAIVKYLIDNNINDITKEVTRDYARINSNLNSNTIARNMEVFREFCNFLKIQKGIDCYQIPNKLYPQNHHNYTPYIFNHEEIQSIYANLNYINYDYRYSYKNQIMYPIIIKILYQTGMRIGEILNLKLNNYNYEFSIFTLIDTKNNEDRNVAIPSSLNEEIRKYIIKFSVKDKIFTITCSAVEEYFKNVLRLSNINLYNNGPRLHDLRHTYVVHNIEQAVKRKDNLDVFLPILQAQLGHKSLTVLSYYFHITNDVLNITTKISEEELGYLIRELVNYE